MPVDKRPDKIVPLVMYKGGERLVIGSAYLKGDGSIVAQIAKDVRQELSEMIFGDRVGDLSLNPKIPPIIDPGVSHADVLTVSKLRSERESS